MACFTVPLAEAVIVSAAKKVAKKAHCSEKTLDFIDKKVGWLEKMLYGGSALLAVEHLYHGEISVFPPFLTALNTPEEIPVMLHEMATSGVAMALLTTAVWGMIVGVSSVIERSKKQVAANEGGR